MASRISGVITGTAAALGKVTTDASVKRLIIVISGLTSETISVTGCVNAAVFTGKLRPINLNTGAVEATDSDLGNGEFLFDNLSYEEVKFTKSAATETAVVSWSLSTAT